MKHLAKIIKAIDEFLESEGQDFTTPPEANVLLEKKGLLNDYSSRSGLPLRKILRNGMIPHAYKKGANWRIPHSRKVKSNNKPTMISNNYKENIVVPIPTHKLASIGGLIIKIIEERYGEQPTCYYEYKPDWLLSNPSKELIEKYPEVSRLYTQLTDNQFTLTEKQKHLSERQLKQKQSFDIWIGEPFNFALEFDEKQHFNQFRKTTLDFYDEIDVKYPMQLYRSLNDKIEIKPGKSGFTKLSSKDPLFPEMLEGEKQDNRIRQRAFRDYLKDLLPIENGFKPTLRIPYQVVNNKVKNFTEEDIDNVRQYIIEYDLI